MSENALTHHYFVDEAGDLTLFGRRGAVLVGTPGCSKAFMLGVANIADPKMAEESLNTLRAGLLADPYFKGVPSMQPQAKRTFVGFHAKDDAPEVRREVFKLLAGLDVKVLVAIRRKTELVAHAQFMHSCGVTFKANDVYDDLVKRVFKDLLHRADHNEIVFARLGKKDRREALKVAIEKARANFERTHGIESNKPTKIASKSSITCAGLQVVDYYLWALQRLYERGEERFYELLRPRYRLIMDLDDTRNKRYGEWYSDANPLDVRKIKAL